MKVLCKNTYRTLVNTTIFNENNWYVLYSYIDIGKKGLVYIPIPNSYSTNNCIAFANSYSTNNCIAFVLKDNFYNEDSYKNSKFWASRIFEDYFYTQKELRKIKLNQINESSL